MTAAAPAAHRSYANGASETPLLGETIGENLRRSARQWADRPALVSCEQGIRWSYRQLDERVDGLASGLIAAGVEKGDRVGLWAPNCAEWTLVQYATARIGAILVNVNPAYRTHELVYALRQSGTKLLIAAPEFKGSDYRAMAAEVRGDCPRLESAVFLGDTQWDSLAAARVDAPALAERAASLSFEDPINIQYTSGTTGSPKGATLSHHNILNNAYLCGGLLGYSEQDAICIPVPFYHCFGMVMGNLAATSRGACMVTPAPSFEPEATLAAVQAEACTALYGVPTMFIAELEHPRFAEFDLTSLRTGIMAGSPCPIEVMRRVVAEMHMPEVTIAYGMTERRGALHPRLQRHARLLGGPRAHRRSDRRAGWMHTGDLATMDENGYCRIVVRIKDMVIRGGENIYPREVEEFLYGHPDIAEVQIVGVPDGRYGEELCAWVRVRSGALLTEEDVREHCRGGLAHFKAPRYVVFVEEFPMTVTGKVQKFRMREESIVRLDLDA